MHVEARIEPLSGKLAKEIFKNAGAEDISSTGESSAPKDRKTVKQPAYS